MELNYDQELQYGTFIWIFAFYDYININIELLFYLHMWSIYSEVILGHILIEYSYIHRMKTVATFNLTIYIIFIKVS